MKTLNFICMLALVLFIVVPQIVGLESHCFNAFDLGIYSRALAAINATDLNPWISVRGVRIFFDHFDPILVPFSFFTRVLSAPYLAISLEWLAAGLASLSFVYAYNRSLISFNWACYASLCVLLSHAAGMAFNYPGHPSTWSVGILAWACLFLRIQRYSLSLLMFFICCLFKEEYAVYLFVIAACVAYKQKKQRAISLVYFFVSCLWLFGVFYLRPRLADIYVGYEQSLGRGFLQSEKLFNYYSDGAKLKALLLMILPFLPLLILRLKLSFERSLLLILLMVMLGIRFFGMWWFPHRSLQWMIVGLWALLPQVERAYHPQKSYRWVVVASWICFLVSAQPTLKNVRTLWGEPYKKMCPRDTSRLSAIEEAYKVLLEDPLKLAAVQSNLVPGLFNRDRVILLEGDYLIKADYILVEKFPFGDAWPLSEVESQEMQKKLLSSTDWNHVIDNDHILLAARK